MISLINRYLDGHLDPFITLLEVQKLMYFAEKAGEPLNLQFKKSHYGPYSPKIRRVLQPLIGHYLSGYIDGDKPNAQIELVPGAIEKAQSNIQKHPDRQHHFERVSQLVHGFESSFDLELLATVCWVADEYPCATDEEIIQSVHGWDPRKQRFSPCQIRQALIRLREQDWLSRSQY